MMKLRVMILLMVLVMLCTGVAAEDGTYRTAGELFRSLGEAFPDALTGVWSTDGGIENLTFGVTDNEEGDALREEILRLVENDDTVTIVTQKYPKRYLQAVQEEIRPYFEDIEIGMVAMGIHEMDNCLFIDLLKEKAGTEKTEAFLAMVSEKYGDAVKAECNADGYAQPAISYEIALETPRINNLNVMTTDSDRAEPNVTPWQFAVFAVGAVLLVGAVGVIGIRQTSLRKTDGSTVTVCECYTVRETEKAVQESAPQISQELDDRILRLIRELRKE